jgi:hypothetical protein
VKRNLLGGGAIALMFFIGCAAGKPPATSANPPLTLNKYTHIQRGMTYDQVVAIVGPPQTPCTKLADSKGELTVCVWHSGATAAPVPVAGVVKVVFSNGRVVKKSERRVDR